MTSTAATLGSTLLILAGLLLPGTIWARAARWPLPGLAGGVISALGLFSGILVLTGCGAGVTVFTLGGWQAGLAVAGISYWRRHRPILTPGKVSFAEWWIALPVMPMIAVAVWRAITQPLPGADVDFRWNYLAEVIVNTGGLDHYPAFTAVDFAHFFWPDGIAPLVSGLYVWSYLAAGSTATIWTALPVLLQYAGLLTLLFALGRCWGGARGGWFACALGGATMLLQFALNLGQETGLTALGVGGLAYYLTQWEHTRRSDLLIPAAACAALVACAREYGLIFPVVGAVWLLVTRAGWRQTAGFALGALALPAAWHVRNWLRTGNPFYAQDAAGIFPVNPVFAEWMRGYLELYGEPLRHWSGWWEVGRMFVLTALPAWLGLLAGAALWRRQPGWTGLLGLAGATLVCWLVSVPYTAGGLFYSMRVLSPLLLLGCAWGGAVLARWVPGRRHLAGVWLGLVLYSLDASLRAWTIPLNPYAIAPGEWPAAGYTMQRDFERQNRPFLMAASRVVSGKVLSETVAAQGVFRTTGAEVVPLWSPEVAFLFSPAGPGEAVARLRQMGFTHVLLTRVQSSVDFLKRTGVLDQLQGRLQGVMMNDTFVLFVLQPGPAAQPALKMTQALPPNPGATHPLRPVGWLAVITLLGWLAFALWPGLLLTLGIHDYGTRYLDSYALLAAVDAVRAGADPHGANPLDALMRNHVYSDWWLALRWLGLTREHNFALGTAWVGVFGVVAWLTARPRRLGETFWLAALLLSPPVALSIKRANNDLVIFVLLAACALAATASARWRQIMAVACLALATGLKYFPATAALAFLWIRPVRRMPAVLLAALVAVVLALASVWTQIDRSRFMVPSTVHTMGAPLWWRELGWKDSASALPGLLLIVAAAAVLALGRVTAGLTVRGEPRERMRAALGAITVLTCFVAGVNYAYRWIFILWPALWLWRQAAGAVQPGIHRWSARFACALILLCVWLDGMFCLVVNEFIPVMSEQHLTQLQSTWRLWTQPLHWLLMMLLAGWLLEAGLATVREWWGKRHAS